MSPDIGSCFSSRRAFLVALAAIVVVAWVVRWDGLDAIGVGGNDTILYYSLAEQWLQGNFVFRIGDSIEVCRPVLLAFNALALQIFDHTDDAIKRANSLLDLANLLVLSRLAWMLSRRRAVVLACAASYAIMPLAVWSARQELAHTISTFFSLNAFLAIWLASCMYNGRRSLVYSFLAGLCVGAAALTHEDLIFLAAPLALFLLFARGFRVPLLEDFQRLAIFSAGPLVAAAVVLFYEFATVKAFVSGSMTSVGREDRIFLEVVARFLWDGIVGGTSATMAVYLAVALAFLGWEQVFKRAEPGSHFFLGAGFCIVTAVSFVLASAIFFGTFFPRGFLPVLPLVVVAAFYSLAKITEALGKILSGTILAAAVILLALSNLASFSAFNVADRKFSSKWAEPVWPTRANLERGFKEFLVDAKYVPSYATHWGNVFNTFEGKVDAEHRLLVLPSTVFYSPGRRALQTDVYFGDNAVYRLDHAAQSLAEVVEAYNVQWVLFTFGQLRTEPTRLGRYLYRGQWAPSEPLDLANLYGLAEYSVKAELRATLRYLHSVGAKEIFPYPRGSFESLVSRAWRLPQ